MSKNSLWKILACLFLIYGLLLVVEKPAKAEQYAILVGIWEYHNKDLKLEAPPNDLELMKCILYAGGVPSDRINILTNPDKSQIQRAFRGFSKRLRPDDSLLFYFSGHGTQIIDKFGTFPGDEAKGRYPDKNDEALLPVDADLASPDTYLLDDELNAMLQEFQTKEITCIIDTCYSGDILKEIRLGKVKGTVNNAPTDIHHQIPAFSRTEDILDGAAEFALLLAAAPYNQVVHELRVPVHNDYLSISAMTYSLYRQVMQGAIPELDPGATGMSNLTYRELVQQIQEDHQEWNLPWMPVLEGPEDRFDDLFLEVTSFTLRDEMLNLKTIAGYSMQLRQSELFSAGGGDFRLGLLNAPKVRHCAIVIGVDVYPPPFQSLKYAAADAKAVRDVFLDAGFMVTLMTPDSLLQPTKENIIRQLERHGQLEEIDLLTIYLSGHGEDIEGTGYFLPMDIADPISQSGLSLEELFAILKKANAKHRFIIVDACRVAPKQRFIADLSRYSEESNIIFTACDSNQWAPEVPQLQHGLFTYFLLKGLAGESEDDRGAATPDGRVTVLSLLDYVMRGIEDWYTHLPAEIGLPQQITPRVLYNGSYVSLLNNQGINPMILNNQNISPIRRVMDKVERTIGEATDGKQNELHRPEKRSYRHTPLAISLVPDFSSTSNVIPNVSLNLLAGRYAKLNGVEFGVLNMETEEMRWAQFAGVANIVGGDAKGFQVAGTFNSVRGNVNALQISGAANIARGNVRVAQLAGAVNIADGDLEGMQTSGIANYAGGNVRVGQLAGAVNIANGSRFDGVQASGAVNYADGNVRVAQLAGVINIANGDLEGIQASGAVNVANNLRGAQVSVVNIADSVIGSQIGVVNIGRKVRGTQVGVINFADEMEGAPIGIFSFVRKGQTHIDLWTNETSIANIALKTGSKHVYSILALGYQPGSVADTFESGAKYRWSLGGGIGVHIPLGSRLVNIEALSYHVNEGEVWTNEFHQLNNLRLIYSWEANSRFSIFAGLTLNVLVSQRNSGDQIAMAPFLKYDDDIGNLWVRAWPGFVVGFQF